jgi:hypothetical protein
MSALRILSLALALTIVAPAQQTVSFATDDGGQVCAHLYGQGSNAVVLAHGGRFNKESRRDLRAQYERAPQPKQLIVLDGSAHAQFLFQSEQNARVMQEIVRFLSAP